jgi:hypothetical protein
MVMVMVAVRVSLSLALWYLVSWVIWLQMARGIAVNEEGANSAPGDQGRSESTSTRRGLFRALKA